MYASLATIVVASLSVVVRPERPLKLGPTPVAPLREWQEEQPSLV